MDEIAYLDPYPQNKKVLLMLHGLGSDGSSWLLQFEALNSAGYRPIAIDIPGFGKSAYSLQRWRMNRVASMIISQVVNRFPSPISMIGLSLGGVVAQEVFRLKSDSFDKLILASTFVRLHPKANQNLSYLNRRMLQIFTGNIRKQASLVAKRIFPLDEQQLWRDYLIQQISNADPRIYRQAMIALAIFNGTGWMRKCKLPCLVISGSEDTTVTLQDQEILAKRIPKSRHVIIPDGGHAVHVDHAEQFNQNMISFLTE